MHSGRGRSLVLTDGRTNKSMQEIGHTIRPGVFPWTIRWVVTYQSGGLPLTTCCSVSSTTVAALRLKRLRLQLNIMSDDSATAFRQQVLFSLVKTIS